MQLSNHCTTQQPHRCIYIYIYISLRAAQHGSVMPSWLVGTVGEVPAMSTLPGLTAMLQHVFCLLDPKLGLLRVCHGCCTCNVTCWEQCPLSCQLLLACSPTVLSEKPVLFPLERVLLTEPSKLNDCNQHSCISVFSSVCHPVVKHGLVLSS